MVASYTENLRITKQGTNDNPNTWGTILNAQVFELIEQAIAEISTVNVTGSSNITLTTNNGASDQARSATLVFTGTIASELKVFLPSVQKQYVVHGTQTGGDLSLEILGGTQKVLLKPGVKKLIYTDGVNVHDVGIEGVVAGGDLEGTYPNPTLTETGVVADTYSFSSFTVDEKGRISEVTNAIGTATASSIVDLGTVDEPSLTITGDTAITSFGSSAKIGQIKVITFASTPVITHSTSGIIVPGSQSLTAASGDVAIVQHIQSGIWRIMGYFKADGTSVAPSGTTGGLYRALTIKNDASTPNSKMNITVGGITLENSLGSVMRAQNVNVTVDFGTTGANGLDAGTKAANTWYYLYVISNGTTTAGLASTSSTAPTLPSGYTFVSRVGAARTDGSSNLKKTLQRGNEVIYTLRSEMVDVGASAGEKTITAGIPTEVASHAKVHAYGAYSSNAVIIEVSADSSGPVQFGFYGYTVGNASNSMGGVVQLTGTTLYVPYSYLGGSSNLWLSGWTDNL